MAAAPVNTALMALCTVIWFVMWNRRAGFEDVAISYAKVVRERQYYRMVTAAFTHLDVMHILFNMATLWTVGVEEQEHGHYWYARTTTQLLLASKLTWLAVVYALVKYGNRPGAAEQPAVGYSGVIFGWIALMVAENPRGSASVLGLFSVPRLLYPVALLLLTQLIIRRASFVGHLAGMLAGFAVGFGGLAWLGDVWWWGLFLAAAGVMLLSLKANSSVPARWLRWIEISPEYAARGPWMLLGWGDGAAGRGGSEGAAAPRRYMDDGVLHVSRGRVDIEDAEAGIAVVAAAAARGGAAAQPAAAMRPPPAAIAAQGPARSSSSGGDAGGSARPAAASPA
jgi:membrane associated rhomboid family serine protease